MSENQSSSAIVLRFCTCDGRPTDARCDRTYRASVDPRHCLMSPFLQKYDLEIWFLFLLHVPSASTLPVETKQHKLHLFSLTRIHVRHKTSTSRYLVFFSFVDLRLILTMSDEFLWGSSLSSWGSQNTQLSHSDRATHCVIRNLVKCCTVVRNITFEKTCSIE